jgi:subtilisin family serine protease
LFFSSGQLLLAQSSAPTANNQVVVNTQKATAYPDLLDKAQRNGNVRLIVGLALPLAFDPEGELTSQQAVDRQRAAIAGQQQTLLDTLAGQNAQVYARYRTVPYLALQVDAAALTTLNNSAQVISLEEDSVDRLSLGSSTVVIGAPTLWNNSVQGAGQTVVILDTGVDAAHPFLGGRISGEACFSNPSVLAGAQSLCPNGQATQTGAGAANANVAACLLNGQQLCDHGTHVAGIVAGSGNAFSGVAPTANLIAIQVFVRVNDPAFCAPQSACVVTARSDQISALEYILSLQQSNPNLKIAAVNMSLGGGKYQDQARCDQEQAARKAAIDNLRSVKIATMIAAGNQNYTDGIGAPACISSAIAVGATTDADRIANFSNMHDMVELLAPGVDIESSVVGGGFDGYNGTSMATPHVAGAWALLKSINPDADVDEILQKLTSTGVAVADSRPNGTVTKPRINVAAAGADPRISAIQPNSAATGAQVTVNITGVDTNFAANATTVEFGAGITVGAVRVNSATSLAVDLTVAASAEPGVRTVKVTTGAEVVTKADGFTVTGLAPTPVIAAIQPDNAERGKAVTVTITGADTHFVAGRTAADFGPGITVDAVTVNSATSVVVALTIAATAEPGERTVQLTTGAEVVTKAQGFRVNLPLPPTGNATLYFDPSPATLKVGETQSIAVVVSPGNTPINGVQINGKLDPAHLQLLNVTSNNSVLTQELAPLTFDAATGVFNFGAGILGDVITEPVSLLTLEVKGVAPTDANGTQLKYLHTFPATDITGPSGSVMEAALDGLVLVTETSSTATLHGRIDLQGRPNKPAPSWSIPLTVELLPAGSNMPQTYNVTTDEQGEFRIDNLIPGDYRVRVKGNHTLGNQIDTMTLALGENDYFLGVLLEGDVETNRSRNQAVLADFGQLSGSFDRCAGMAGYVPNADLNERDDCVTIEDFGLLSPNFNTQGWIVYPSPTAVAAPLPLAQPNARLTFGQPTQRAPLNTPINLPLYVDPANGEGVIGLTVHLRYDPTLVEVTDVTLTDRLPRVLLKPTVDPVTGSLRFSLGANLGQRLLDKAQVATIQVVLKAETANAPLTLVTATPRDTNIAGANGGIMAGVEDITLYTGDKVENAFRLYLPTARR